MLSQKIEEKLAEVLVDRIEETNTYILEQVGKSIKEISNLKPSDAYRLGQIIKYGGSYEKIAKELARITGKNIQDIYKIFEEVAKNNKQFAKEFYKYRGIDYIPYNKDLALKYQVNSLATLTANSYMNISNTRGLGYLIEGIDGQLRFRNIQDAYYEIIDKAIIGIAQGKTTFQEEMRNALKQMGHNGLVMYQSGRVRRFDSAVRMNILDGIRQLNIETSKRFGMEYGADGVEISVHENPAPDHADIQGRQFSNAEYEILENGGVAKDVKGIKYDGSEKRHIGEYNCYHKIFAIVLGVSEPEYTDEELNTIKERNEKGFDYNGKHYTMYEGTQLQRKLETDIRRNKDTQILARASGFDDLAQESQAKINMLTKEYDRLCKTSGLLPKKQRMQVSGYRKIKVGNMETYRIYDTTNNLKDDNDYEKLRKLHRKNIDNKTRAIIYHTDWENNDKILNPHGYINSSENSENINRIMRYPYLRKEYNEQQLLEYDKTIEHMEKAINSNTIPENIIVTRYVSRNWLEDKLTPREFFMGTGNINRDFLNIQKIKEINENSFISTSLSYSPYANVTEKNIRFEIKVDKGTNAFVTENIWESEIIFNKSNLLIENVELIDGEIVITAKLKKYKKINFKKIGE